MAGIPVAIAVGVVTVAVVPLVSNPPVLQPILNIQIIIM